MDATSLMRYANTDTASMTALESFVNANPTLIVVLAIAVGILSGVALWKVARLKETVWFWALFFISTLGILPIIYLYIRRHKHV